MRFETWNVAHQTRRHRDLPEAIGHAIGKTEPDVLVLTEYVGNDTHAPFLRALAGYGLSNVRTSLYLAGQNQVLIASRYPMEPGSLTGPTDNMPSTRTNWLHVRMPELGVDVVGMRVPMFKDGKDRRRYWDWFENIVPTLVGAPTVLLGDFNADPARRRAIGGAHLSRLESRGWQIVTPPTGWAYRGKTGNTSRIDHGLASPGFIVRNAEYCAQCNGQALAGSPTNGYSDHALLKFELDLPAGARSERSQSVS